MIRLNRSQMYYKDSSLISISMIKRLCSRICQWGRLSTRNVRSQIGPYRRTCFLRSFLGRLNRFGCLRKFDTIKICNNVIGWIKLAQSVDISELTYWQQPWRFNGLSDMINVNLGTRSRDLELFLSLGHARSLGEFGSFFAGVPRVGTRPFFAVELGPAYF